MRLKKRRPFLLSIQTTRNYEHAFTETLVALMSTAEHELSVQLVLTPAPGFVHRRARRLLKRRERALQYADQRDPGELGIDSVVEVKELKGALETQHRSLAYFDLRIAGRDAKAVRRMAGVFSQLRSENEFAPPRDARPARALCAPDRSGTPEPFARPARRRALDVGAGHAVAAPARARKTRPASRATVRRAIAPPDIDRDETRMLLRDERGPVAIAPTDRKYGHALIGGQGGGKSSVMARHFANDARDPDRAVILIDPKGPLAELCRGLAPADRTVHYLDLGRPEIGFNPLAIKASPGARAAVFLQALIEANPPGAIQAASDSFLRQAVAAVCTVEPNPTLWHVYRLLDVTASRYREHVVERLSAVRGAEFARAYWAMQFPALISDRGYAAQALNPPRNKLERLISTREIDTLLRHPVTVELEGIIERGEILIVAGAKAAVGEDNTVLVTQLLLQLLHRALQAQHDQPETQRRRVSLLIDEAHNVLTPSVAKMLAEGRSAGLDAVFAWQYSAQIRDEVIRSGVRSLLQSISIFRMREMEDARSLAGLAMEIYSDRISIDQEEQERLRFSPDDIVKLPITAPSTSGSPTAFRAPASSPPRCRWKTSTASSSRNTTARAQHERGGHHPESLGDPLLNLAAASAPSDGPRPAIRGRARRSRTPAANGKAAGRAPAETSGPYGRQLSVRASPELQMTISSELVAEPASYVEAHRYDGAAIHHDRPGRTVPCALQPRDIGLLRDLWRYKVLTAPQILELWWPGRCARAGQRRLRKLFDAGYLERFRPITRRGSFPWTYHLANVGHRLLQQHHIIAPGQRFAPRRVYDYGHVLHDLQLNAWVLAYRRLLGGALLTWEGETDIEPPRHPQHGHGASGRRLDRQGAP